MDTAKFEKILIKSESLTLDFKSEQYDLEGDKTGEKTAEFIKDIISFANTIRDESAYIIIGIEEIKNGSKNLLGLNKNIDDATFQQKIKDKVNPKPIFSYSVFQYNKMNFGVFEIPIHYYSEPITPLKNLKGLEIGKVYFRRGTSNSEATISEIIKINDWFRTLKPISIRNDYLDELSKILIRLNETNIKLAPIAADLLRISKMSNNNATTNFFKSEIAGWDKESIESLPNDFFNYRRQKVIVSPIVIESITSSILNTRQKVYENLKSRSDTDEMAMFFAQPISLIDSEIDRIKQNGIDNLYFKTQNMRDLLTEKNIEGELRIYYLYDTFYSLSQNIRFKYIDELMHIMK